MIEVQSKARSDWLFDWTDNQSKPPLIDFPLDAIEIVVADRFLKFARVSNPIRSDEVKFRLVDSDMRVDLAHAKTPEF